jgi:4-hydroxyphenylpyruvate dioxygenase
MNLDNPAGTDGFEFLEFTTLNRPQLENDFAHLGLEKIASHKNKNITLHKQGEINFFINTDENSSAFQFAQTHGASVCAMGFRVIDANHAYQHAIALGATPFISDSTLPAIMGIGGSVIYFVDAQNAPNLYTDAFNCNFQKQPYGKAGLTYIDHVTHNVNRGEMTKWATFYEKIFNFREIRYFDIKGQKTGLTSRALSSPCGKIRIPINESSDDKSQIAEFIQAFNGEGIQHIALGTDDIYHSVHQLKQNTITFLDTPDTYYRMIKDRVPWHAEDTESLRAQRILLDGGKTPEAGLLLQIFTENMLGPVFFEIIQRKGNEGFGEGNFQALFEAIERDQMERGVI